MRVVNRTPYSTRDLRRFVVRAANEMLTDAHAWRKARVVVMFDVTSRRRESTRKIAHGLADVGGPRVNMKLPSPKHGIVDRFDLAWTLCHEFAHTRGERHRGMSGRWYASAGRYGSEAKTARLRLAWAETLPLELAKKTGKPKTDRASETLTRSRALLSAWERKLKLARTKVAKYKSAIARGERYINKRNEAQGEQS